MRAFLRAGNFLAENDPSPGLSSPGGTPHCEEQLVSFLLSCFVFSGLLSALDLVEVNPRLAVSEEEAKATASLAVDVIASSFGQTREGGHVVYDQLPTPSSPDESESEERVRI